MKRIIGFAICIAVLGVLSAQNFCYKNDSTTKYIIPYHFYHSVYRFNVSKNKPIDLKLREIKDLLYSSVQPKDNMPVAKPSGHFNMPVLRLKSIDNMPIYKPDSTIHFMNYSTNRN